MMKKLILKTNELNFLS